jgi:hypothetical protein
MPFVYLNDFSHINEFFRGRMRQLTVAILYSKEGG